MENTVKVTKVEYFEAMKTLLNGGSVEIPATEIIAFCDREIESLHNKAVKAKERAEKNREAGDELRATILNVLSTDEAMTSNDVCAAVIEATGDDSITVQKLSSRIAQLVELGQVEKDSITIKPENGGKASKRITYRRIG